MKGLLVLQSGREVAGFVIGSLRRYCWLCDLVRENLLVLSKQAYLGLQSSSLKLLFQLVLQSQFTHWLKSWIHTGEMSCVSHSSISFLFMGQLNSMRGLNGESMRICMYLLSNWKERCEFIVVFEQAGLRPSELAVKRPTTENKNTTLYQRKNRTLVFVCTILRTQLIVTSCLNLGKKCFERWREQRKRARTWLPIDFQIWLFGANQ